ncbi:MAG TPA: hypothetical protein VFZ03_06875 [Dongiaceae bacterium]
MLDFIFPSWPGEDPAIQFSFGATLPDLDHRVSQLRCGPAMTEKNQILAADGIKLLTFFVPDSRVLGMTIHEFCLRQLWAAAILRHGRMALHHDQLPERHSLYWRYDRHSGARLAASDRRAYWFHKDVKPPRTAVCLTLPPQVCLRWR